MMEKEFKHLQISYLPLIYFEWTDFRVFVSLISLILGHLKRKQMVDNAADYDATAKGINVVY